MEQGGSSTKQRNNTKRAPRSGGVHIREPTENTNTQPDADNLSDLPQHQSYKRKNDQYVPLANVNRIMRRVLPPNAKISDDSKETMQECVSEFISFVTKEANQLADRQCRKTISAEDIISAMATLGFDDYVEPLTIFLDRSRSQNMDHNPRNQASIVRRNTGLFHPHGAQFAPPPPPTLPSGHDASMQPGASNIGGDNYAGLPEMSDVYMGYQFGAEGSSNRSEFDVFNQFK